MKKFILLFCILFSFSAFTACSGDNAVSNEHEIISEAIGTDVSAGSVISSEDTHGGFFGDGTLFIELEFEESSRDEFEAQLKDSGWSALPFGKELEAIAY